MKVEKKDFLFDYMGEYMVFFIVVELNNEFDDLF